MNINIRLGKNFVTQYNRLQGQFGTDIARINGFDDNWTNTGMPEKFRYFCMGNALVVPMITRIGKVLDGIIESEQ